MAVDGDGSGGGDDQRPRADHCIIMQIASLVNTEKEVSSGHLLRIISLSMLSGRLDHRDLTVPDLALGCSATYTCAIDATRGLRRTLSRT